MAEIQSSEVKSAEKCIHSPGVSLTIESDVGLRSIYCQSSLGPLLVLRVNRKKEKNSRSHFFFLLLFFFFARRLFYAACLYVSSILIFLLKGASPFSPTLFRVSRENKQKQNDSTVYYHSQTNIFILSIDSRTAWTSNQMSWEWDNTHHAQYDWIKLKDK
jgi:hypothetical protein